MHTPFSHRKQHGFTIVELLVVLAILVILSAIVYGSYTSIQTRARQENAKNSALYLQRRLQAYYNVVNNFPSPPTTATTQLNAQNASKLNSTVTLGTPSFSNGERTLKLQLCTSGVVGYAITYWDYVNNSLPSTAQLTGGPGASSCTTWTTAT